MLGFIGSSGRRAVGRARVLGVVVVWSCGVGMDRKKAGVPLVCHGHSRPVVDLFYSPVTPDGCFLISASKGKRARVP